MPGTTTSYNVTTNIVNPTLLEIPISNGEEVYKENFEKQMREYESERNEKIKSENLKSKQTFFVAGGSHINGLNDSSMRLFNSIIRAKEYKNKIKKTNDFTEISLVTESGEFIYLLKSDLNEFVRKESGKDSEK